jgi:TRAP-type C4-dicarboxylate transport system permease small subunit
MNQISIRHIFCQLVKISELIQKYSTVFLLASMVFIIGLQVFFRYFLGRPLSWTEELARLFQIWLTFLIIGQLLGLKDHIAISYFIERMPLRLSILLRTLNNFIILIFSVLLIRWGNGLLEAQPWMSLYQYFLCPL